MGYQIHEFRNGIRLVHKQTASFVAHFGITIHTGSRDENPDEHGMAHFIEHSFFKGTKKRKPYHIISRIEDAGGEINAYTTKEETCIYASFLRSEYEHTIELICDLVSNPVFPDREISREKSVILDEILSYKDSPAELIFDEFEDLVFTGHPIGRNILGNEKSIEALSRTDLQTFFSENYATSGMTLSSVGNIDFGKLVILCDKYFGQIPGKKRIRSRLVPDGYSPRSRSLEKDTFQVHCIIGNTGYSIFDERRTALHLLTNILGGPGMKSRLNMSLREKRGYSYNVEMQYTPYTDCGILMVYFGCDKEKYHKSFDLVLKEFKNMGRSRMGSLQLSRAKKQLIGQVSISLESNEHEMLSIGKSLLVYDRVDTLEEIIKKIDTITSDQLLEAASVILRESQLSVLTYQ